MLGTSAVDPDEPTAVPTSNEEESEKTKAVVDDDSDDDEPIVRRKPTRMNRSLLADSDDDEPSETAASHKGRSRIIEDSDEEDDVALSSVVKEKKSTEEEDRKSENDESDEDDFQVDEKPKDTLTVKRKPRQESESESSSESDGSSSGSDSDAEDGKPLSSAMGTGGLPGYLFDGDSEDDDDYNPDSANKGQKISTGLPDDVFDAEGSDGEDRRRPEGDDDDEEPEISAALRRKLAKGAAKKEKPARAPRAQRPKKDDVQMIHSETQRLIRESDVRLPYHKPERLGINVFLARTQQKQAQLKQVLKHSPVCTWKTAPGLATQPPLKTLPPKHWEEKDSFYNRINDKLNDSRNADPEDIDDDNLPDITASDTPVISKPVESEERSSQEEKSNSEDPGMDSVENSESPSVDSEVKESTAESEPPQVPHPMEIDEDDLPDLIIEVEKKGEAADNMEETKEDEIVEQTLENTAEVAGDVNKVEEKVESKPEQDSGFLTAPTSEEENSGDKPAEKEVIEEPSKSVEKSAPPSSSLTPKLGGLGLGFTPKLSGEPSDFIDLDEDEEAEKPQPPKNPGLVKLMDRLVKHSTKRTRKARDVELSTVHKETTGSGPEVLKMERVTVHLEGDATIDPDLEKPGAKLRMLKEKLKSGMQARRAEMRKEREEVEGFDNEEGFEEEEAELTDQSDTDGEPEEEMEEEELLDEEDILDEEGEMEEEEEKDENPFLDGEAEEDEEEFEEGDMNLQLDTADDSDEADGAEPKKPAKDFLKSALKKTKTMEFFDDDAMSESPAASQMEKGSTQSSDISDRPFEQLSQGSKKKSESVKDTSGDAEPQSMLSLEKEDTSQQSVDTVSTTGTADSSLDMSSLISGGQNTGKRNRSSFFEGRSTPELFTPSSKGSVTTLRGSKKVSGSLSSLTLPIEDSQDLLCGNSMPSSQTESTPRQLAPSSFHFNLEDTETQSQLLDADGLFRDKTFDNKQARRQLRMESASNSTNDNYDELLDLCSGKFTEGANSEARPKPSAPAGLFGMSQLNRDDSSQQDMDELLGLCSGRFTGTKDGASSDVPSSQRPPLQTQGSMDELLGLCSGKFTTTADSPSQKRGKKRRPIEEEEEEEDDFEMASDAGDADREDEGDELSDEEGAEAVEEEEDEEVMLAKRLFSKKGGKISKAFVEDEAELSGSDAESDEDYDGTEQDDMLEGEAGDLEDLPSDDELRDQVGRVHLKALIDEDKRQLRLYQEMYLEDGDLHSEGAGRQRKFRWKNIDDEDTQQDMFRNSDEEAENEDQENVEQETKWRMERFEREKFLAEQAAEPSKEETEGSQLVRLGKVVFKQQQNKGQQQSKSQPQNKGQQQTKVTSSQEAKPAKAPAQEKKANPTKNMFKVPSHHGSFLRRDKTALAKIAEMTKPMGNLGGARNSGNFVFSTLSPSEPETKKAKPKRPPPVQRSTSSPASSQPAKKPRLDKKSQSLPANSIFNLL